MSEVLIFPDNDEFLEFMAFLEEQYKEQNNLGDGEHE